MSHILGAQQLHFANGNYMDNTDTELYHRHKIIFYSTVLGNAVGNAD